MRLYKIAALTLFGLKGTTQWDSQSTNTEEKRSEKLDKRFLAHLLKDVTINSIQQEKAKLWTEEAKMDERMRPIDRASLVKGYQDVQFKQKER